MTKTLIRDSRSLNQTACTRSLTVGCAPCRYMRDDNKVPAMYVLQRISKNIPTFASEVREERWQAGDEWWNVQGTLHGIFNRAAERIGTTWDQLCAPTTTNEVADCPNNGFFPSIHKVSGLIESLQHNISVHSPGGAQQRTDPHHRLDVGNIPVVQTTGRMLRTTLAAHPPELPAPPGAAIRSLTCTVTPQWRPA